MNIEQGGPLPDQRGEKAPFFFWKDLLSDDKNICYRLVNSGGMLGWNKKSLNAAHIKSVQAEDLVKREVLRRTNLFQLAKEFIEDDFSRGEKEDLNKQGGFVFLTNKKDRDFFRSFDQAFEIVNDGETADNLEERYQIARKDVYDFIDLMF